MRVKSGVTLVEILVVMAIIVLLAMAMVGGVDPIGLVNKARDAQRKKDVNRIKVAFEEYYNDKGCYPDSETISLLTASANCGSKVFSPWLSTWPCDPNKIPYTIMTGYDNKCPKWYKILTSLENKNDKDIFADLTEINNIGTGATDLNYGVSSGNISVSEETAKNDPYCVNLGNCYYYPEANKCNRISVGCAGSNCYLGECSNKCKVSCCGRGCL